ncbi:MAG: YncE family protein, partial [Thermoplasmata archaeon]
ANHGGSTVTFISGNAVTGTTAVGYRPVELGYDPSSDRLLVADSGSNNVTSLSAQSPTTEKDNINIPVGGYPTEIAFDLVDRHDYVANYDSSNLSVISGKGAQYGSIPLPSAEPNGIVWDQAKLSLYVANEGSSTVSIVQGLKVTGTITGPTGSSFTGISYDEATDQVFVSAQGSDKVYVYGSSVGSPGPVPSGTSCSAGDSPAWDAYDPVDHEVYVANQGAAVSGPDNQSLTILNGACKILAAVPLPSIGEPEGDAFDPVSNTVYVTDAVNDEVYVISGTKLVHTITNATFDAPYGVAFDPANGEMAVANSALNTVSFLSGYKVVGTATVGSGPFLFAYDPADVRLLVTNINSDNVTSMNAAAPTDEKANINIPVGLDPHGIAFDVTDSDVYVANVFSHNVTVITGTGGRVGSVPVGSEPEGAVWDQAKLSVYVTNSGSANLSEIQALKVVHTLSVPSYLGVIGIAYDDTTGQVVVVAVDEDAGSVFIET